MDLNDRLTKGFLAGVAGGIAQDIADTISNRLNMDELTFFDWAGIVVYGSKPNSFLEWILSIVTRSFMVGLLGILFVYLIPKVTSRNFIFKGAIFGLAVWFVIFSVVFLFKLTKLREVGALSAASDAVTAIVFGIVLALVYNWLGKRQRITS